MGVRDQPLFLNAVAEVETALDRAPLLDHLLDVERRLGRERVGPRWGPRTIDLDLLLFGDEPSRSRASTCRIRSCRAAVRARAARGARSDRKIPGNGTVSEALAGLQSAHVSNLDELDEFEAEAELRLKKEYGAVFGFFRYCVLTQDATYLCNKLDMQYVPQPSYPFFHLKMEDVWVWDKNRPTRMIPRAEVYTSSDVTIEELRGEGDEPVSHA